MSVCVDCGRKMHPLDAQQFLTCGACGKGSKPIRTLNRQETESAGRSARACYGLDMPIQQESDPENWDYELTEEERFSQGD